LLRCLQQPGSGYEELGEVAGDCQARKVMFAIEGEACFLVDIVTVPGRPAAGFNQLESTMTLREFVAS
jgi:hypothetical protein